MIKKPKHALKDSVFKNLFSDKKYLLELYLALHPEDAEVTEDDIHDVTINPVLMDSEYNDLGFSVGDRLIALVESQSTWSVNIIVRALLYLINTYHDYFERTKQNLYSSKKVKMPVPELYVIYTGTKKDIPGSISLKEEFFGAKNSAIDATVKILSDENDKNIIGEYIMFCRVYDKQRKEYGRIKKAIEETIKICQDKNILYEYLNEREREVIDMMMTLFSEDQLTIAYDTEKEREKEREKAAAVKETAQRVERETAQRVERETAQRVALEEAKEFARRLLKLEDMPADKVAELTNLTIEEVEELKKSDKL